MTDGRRSTNWWTRRGKPKQSDGSDSVASPRWSRCSARFLSVRTRRRSAILRRSSGRAIWWPSATWTRQLGDLARRRVEVRLRAPLHRADVEPHGDPAAASLCAARRRHGPRSRAGLPRRLSAAGRLGALAPCGDRDLRHRHRRGDRHGDRPQPPVRHSARDRRRHHGARRVPHPLAAEQGFRWIEAFVITLLGVIAVCFLVQIALADPDWGQVIRGFAPTTELDHQSGHALPRARHHRRDGDAAQSLPALRRSCRRAPSARACRSSARR